MVNIIFLWISLLHYTPPTPHLHHPALLPLLLPYYTHSRYHHCHYSIHFRKEMIHLHFLFQFLLHFYFPLHRLPLDSLVSLYDLSLNYFHHFSIGQG